MIIPKQMPEVGEFVIIKITKIMPHGAYCRLSEYNMDAYLPISEVSSGWIKNIHEFGKEGQQDVAKVIFVDREKRSVDVSLKKATSKNKKDKINEYSLEKHAEGIFNKAVEASGAADRRAQLAIDVSEYSKTYMDLVNDIFEGRDPLSGFKDNAFKEALYSIVAKTIKPKIYTVAYNVELTTSDTRSGIGTIKEAFGNVEKEGIVVQYLGAPRYRLVATDSSYLKAEERIKKANKILEGYKGIDFSMKSGKVQA